MERGGKRNLFDVAVLEGQDRVTVEDFSRLLQAFDSRRLCR